MIIKLPINVRRLFATPFLPASYSLSHKPIVISIEKYSPTPPATVYDVSPKIFIKENDNRAVVTTKTSSTLLRNRKIAFAKTEIIKKLSAYSFYIMHTIVMYNSVL
jgi:hypothetical protein